MAHHRYRQRIKRSREQLNKIVELREDDLDTTYAYRMIGLLNCDSIVYTPQVSDTDRAWKEKVQANYAPKQEDITLDWRWSIDWKR